jgi:hypothetical protein
MPRLVVPKSKYSDAFGAQPAAAASPPAPGAPVPPPAPPPAPPDTYKDRLVKYIPAESVAFYAFADKMVTARASVTADGSVPTDPATVGMVAWVLFLLGVVLTPIYLYKARQPRQPWFMHACISTIAFGLWAYTLEGSVFKLNGWYDVFYAGLLAPVFTFVAGAFEPKDK